MEGHVSEKSIREALIVSGEMDRWDTIRLGAPGRLRLADAMDAVSDLLNSTLPGSAVTHLTRADSLLREIADLFCQAQKSVDSP